VEGKNVEELRKKGVPDLEIQEWMTLGHAFPHTYQELTPFTRTHCIPGNFLHLTQLSSNTMTDLVIGLAKTYQIIIRFDKGYGYYNKAHIQEMAAKRFKQMNIGLSACYREPIEAYVHKFTKKWGGFLKVDLLSPKNDTYPLLRGDRPFMLPIGSAGAKIIGKVEKGYALKTSELQLHVFREGLAGYTTNELHKELVATAYLAGMEIEFAKIDKPHVTHRYAFVTVATPVSREALLTRPFKIEGMSFTFNTPIPAAEKQQNKESGDKDTRITTTIVITGISRDYGQAKVSNSIRNLIGVDNIVLVSYGQAKFDAQGRHLGTCYVQLANAIVHTQWSRMRPMKLIPGGGHCAST
jgi:hypothetical protein